MSLAPGCRPEAAPAPNTSPRYHTCYPRLPAGQHAQGEYPDGLAIVGLADGSLPVVLRQIPFCETERFVQGATRVPMASGRSFIEDSPASPCRDRDTFRPRLRSFVPLSTGLPGSVRIRCAALWRRFLCPMKGG